MQTMRKLPVASLKGETNESTLCADPELLEQLVSLAVNWPTEDSESQPDQSTSQMLLLLLSAAPEMGDS